MLAFHNDSKIKATYLNRLEVHYKHDEIIKGQYWENGKGCAAESAAIVEQSEYLLTLLEGKE